VMKVAVAGGDARMAGQASRGRRRAGRASVRSVHNYLIGSLTGFHPP
jgi:hypothetical protein